MVGKSKRCSLFNGDNKSIMTLIPCDNVKLLFYVAYVQDKSARYLGLRLGAYPEEYLARKNPSSLLSCDVTIKSLVNLGFSSDGPEWTASQSSGSNF